MDSPTTFALPGALRRAVATALSIAALSAAAAAGDHYVDAATGSDGNGGTSPADAWRTISHAVAAVGAPAPGVRETIHVAAGLYDAALGETIGFELRYGVELVGAGSAVTILDGGGSSLSMIHDGADPFAAAPVPRVEGLTLRNAATGIHVYPEDQEVYDLELRDVRIEGMTGWGITVVRDLADGIVVRLDDVVVEGCGAGAWFDDFGTHGVLVAEVRSSAIRGCAGPGIDYRQGTSSTNDLLVEDTRVEGCFGPAVRVETGVGSGLEVRLRRCALVSNGDAFVGVANPGPTQVDVRLERCTIADNAGAGVRTTGPGAAVPTWLDSCILYGNGDDVADALGQVQGAVYCDVGDGDFAGANGNVSVDPLFVDLAAGDYALQPGSPCIDAGNPALGPDRDCTDPEMGYAFFDQGAPFVYCSGKRNSQGCAPFACGSGTPSASGTAPFVLRAEDAVAGEAGFLLYGFAKANLAFHGGVLCVKAPVTRLLPPKVAQDLGYAPCTGVLRRDFNKRIRSGVDPLLTAGRTVFAQWYQRDPADPAGFGDGLSDAVRFVIEP